MWCMCVRVCVSHVATGVCTCVCACAVHMCAVYGVCVWQRSGVRAVCGVRVYVCMCVRVRCGRAVRRWCVCVGVGGDAAGDIFFLMTDVLALPYACNISHNGWWACKQKGALGHDQVCCSGCGACSCCCACCYCGCAAVPNHPTATSSYCARGLGVHAAGAGGGRHAPLPR